METLSGKTVILMFGVLLSLAMLVGGWEMNAWAVSAYENHAGIFPIILTAALSTIALSVGGLLFVLFIFAWHDGLDGPVLFEKFGDVAYATGHAACFCFIFGTLGLPLNHGLYVNPWDALLVVGFLPLLYFMKEIAHDISSILHVARRKK